MQPTAAKSSPQTRPPCCRVLAASCSRRSGASDTLLRLHLDAGQTIDFRLTTALADALGLRATILGAPPSHKGVATGQGHSATPERIAEYRAAWLRYRADPHLSQYALAAELGCSQATLGQYFRAFAADENPTTETPSAQSPA